MKLQDQMRAQGIEVHVGGGGFAGSGYKYDDNEDEHEANKRKLTKLVHGLEAGGDEEDEDIEQQLNSMMKSKSRVVSRGPTNSSGDTPGPSSRPSRNEKQAQENKVAAARAAAEKIASEKKLNVQPVIEKDATSLTAEAVMKGQQAPSLLMTVSYFRSGI